MRIAICHMWKVLGIAATFSIYLILFYDTTYDNVEALKHFYQIYGYCILGSTLLFVILLSLNELKQRQGLIYNYRDCLDHDNSIANNYGNLFSRNEVIIERNTAATSTGMWKSMENLLPEGMKNHTTLWAVYMLLSKLHGAVIFHYFLMTLAINATLSSLSSDIRYTQGIVLWIMSIEAVVGCIIVRIFSTKVVYIVTSIIGSIAIGVSMIFYDDLTSIGFTICLWIFYGVVVIAVAIPDIALLEIYKIKYNELLLSLGYLIELLAIMLLQYFQFDAHTLTKISSYTDQYYLVVVISTIAILLVTSLFVMLHMPNTFGMSLLEIQNGLLKHKSYFAFDFNPSEKDGSKSQRVSDENNYTTVNMYSQEESVTQSSVLSNTYAELPNENAKTRWSVDYDAIVPQPPAIIPRVTLQRGPALYENSSA
jgi:hypothetical protein